MRSSRQLSESPERGSAIVEYALLLVLIAVACLLALEALGISASTGLSEAASSVAGS